MQKVAHLEHLDGIWLEMAQMVPRLHIRVILASSTNPSEGLAARWWPKTLERALGLPRLINQPFRGVRAHLSKLTKLEPKCSGRHLAWQSFFPFNQPFRGGWFHQPTLPRGWWPEGSDPQCGGGWGGGKPPPESLLLRVLTRRTEGRRIF